MDSKSATHESSDSIILSKIIRSVVTESNHSRKTEISEGINK